MAKPRKVRKLAEEEPAIKNHRLKDLTEIRIVATYMVQKLTFPTITELKEAMKGKLRAVVHPATLMRAMQGAASAGFVSIHKKQTESGTTETAYKMKNLDWRNPPEYAHILDLLPILLQTPEAQQIKQWFDSQEGQGAKKQQRGNDIDNYVALRWHCISTDYLLGSQIACQATDAVRKAFPTEIEKNNIEVDGIWVRDPLTGEFIIPQDVLQGWFAANAMRYYGLKEARATYVAFSPVRITPTRVEQLVLPVMSKKGPSAPKPYEALPPGQTFTLDLLAPTKGVMTVESYEALVLIAGLRPKRGLSPARGRRYGRFLVTKFENLGPLKGFQDLSFLEADIPEPLMVEHGDYYRAAVERLRNLPVPDIFDPGDFPGGTEDDEADEAA